MPIDIGIHDNSSIVKVKPEGDSNVRVKSGCGIDDKRLEALIKELQKNKQNKGFVALDSYVYPDTLQGRIIDNDVLNLLRNYLINKVSYKDTIYYLISDEDLNDSLVYYCYIQEANPNYVTLNKSTGTFVLSKMFLDHSKLSNLDYLSSGHSGFAGIEFGSTEYWDSREDYVPVEGMIVVYTDYAITEQGKLVPNFKIGNGETSLSEIQFVGSDIKEILQEHIENRTIHITQEERERWNNKLNYNEPTSDLLQFTRN